MTEENSSLDALDFGPENQDEPIIEINQPSQSLFIVLTLVTLGLYLVWWNYKIWCYYRDRDKLDIYPAGRTLYAILFLYSFFRRILNRAKSLGYEKTYSPGILLALYFLTTIVAQLPFGVFPALLGFVLVINPVFDAQRFVLIHDPQTSFEENRILNNRQLLLVLFGLTGWAFLIYSYMAN